MKHHQNTHPKQHQSKHNTHQAHNHSEQNVHNGHEGHSVDMFRRKFWISLILTVPTLLYSHTVMSWLKIDMPLFPGSSWVPAILGIVIFLYGGVVFLRGAKAEIKAWLPGMMTLISMAITVAFLYSLAVSLKLLEGMDFWWELATLITIMLLGHWLEMVSIENAQGALQELAKLLPDEAERLTRKGTEIVPVADLRVGDKVLIRPGASIPADGVVIKGISEVNESMLTGESSPITKRKKDMLAAGTINGSGSLTARITKTGNDTALAGIIKLVEEASSSKSKTQVLADKAAYYLTFIAIAVAILTALGWTIFSDRPASFVIDRVVTVLIIACPHALGLAIPLVTAISTTKAAKNGLLIRDRTALENARNIEIVLFDKTGTLTKGEQGITQIVAVDDDIDTLLGLAAGVEYESEHPIARAIVKAAKSKGISAKPVDNFTTLAGRGALAIFKGQKIYVGGPQMLKITGATPQSKLRATAQIAGKEGKTVVYIVKAGQVIGIIILADVIREESKEAVLSLLKNGIQVCLLTGDSREVAQWVAEELKINKYFAEVLPGNKASAVRDIQSRGNQVAMVGDGVNDAPALVQADIGIAIGAGTDVATRSADIILASDDPRGVIRVIKLSNATYRKMLQNLWWATGYNALTMPIAAGVLYNYGLVLAPAVGAILMSLSTIIVALNAQLLRKTSI